MRKMTRRCLMTRGTILAGPGAASRMIAAPVRGLCAQVAPADKPSIPAEQLRILLEKLGTGGGYSRPQISPPTAESLAQELTQTEEVIGQLNAIDRSRLTEDVSIDLRYAESILWGRQIEQAEMMRWKKDTRICLQLHFLSILMTLPNPDTTHNQQVVERLQSTHARLAKRQANIEYCIPRSEMSIFMIDNVISVFRDHVALVFYLHFLGGMGLYVDRLMQKAALVRARGSYAAKQPGYQPGYFLGYSGIVEMRTEFRKKKREQIYLLRFSQAF
jgi:hypothetical protein